MEKVVKKIELWGKELTLDGGKKFIAYKTKTKNGEYMTVSFTQKCENIPKFTHGFVFVENNPECANVSRSGLYPKLWINKIESSEEYRNNNPLDDII